MTHTTYRAGIIGLGFIGGADQVSGDAIGQQLKNLDGTHADALQSHDRVKLVAGASRDPGRRERFAQRSGATTYASWEEMLDKEALDIVSVATYTPEHAPLTIACAQRGIRVIWCEKPIASTLAEADAMLQACEQSGSLLVINHNRRFDAVCRRLRDHVAAGGLGELTSVNLQWNAGRLGNVGTHTIDAALMFTGRRVAAVSATLDDAGKPDCRGAAFRDPGGWGFLRLDDGVMVSVDAADYANTPYHMVVNGTDGRATAGKFQSDITLEYWDGRHDVWPGIKDSAMNQAVREMVQALDGDTPFPCAATESAHTLEVIVACHASSAKHASWVDLPLEDADRDIEVLTG